MLSLLPPLPLKRTQNPCFFSVRIFAGNLHQFEQPVLLQCLVSKIQVQVQVQRGKAKTNMDYENFHLIPIVQAASIS